MADSNRPLAATQYAVRRGLPRCVIFELGRCGQLLGSCVGSIRRNCGTRSQLPQSSSVSDRFRRSLAISVCRQGVRFYPRIWRSTLVSAKIEFTNEGVEHGGFEPPTPCLPGTGNRCSASSSTCCRDWTGSFACRSVARSVVLIECLFEYHIRASGQPRRQQEERVKKEWRPRISICCHGRPRRVST
jgi:hypothetical protein